MRIPVAQLLRGSLNSEIAGIKTKRHVVSGDMGHLQSTEVMLKCPDSELKPRCMIFISHKLANWMGVAGCMAKLWGCGFRTRNARKL